MSDVSWDHIPKEQTASYWDHPWQYVVDGAYEADPYSTDPGEALKYIQNIRRLFPDTRSQPDGEFHAYAMNWLAGYMERVLEGVVKSSKE